jgi:hypothetical protein
MAVFSRGLKCSRTVCTLRFQTAGRLAIERDLLFLRQLSASPRIRWPDYRLKFEQIPF